jgi:hypothetical protein
LWKSFNGIYIFNLKGKDFFMKEIIAQVSIESRIHLIRGKKVMLDRDLAELYRSALGTSIKR